MTLEPTGPPRRNSNINKQDEYTPWYFQTVVRGFENHCPDSGEYLSEHNQRQLIFSDQHTQDQTQIKVVHSRFRDRTIFEQQQTTTTTTRGITENPRSSGDEHTSLTRVGVARLSESTASPLLCRHQCLATDRWATTLSYSQPLSFSQSASALARPAHVTASSYQPVPVCFSMTSCSRVLVLVLFISSLSLLTCYFIVLLGQVVLAFL